MINLNNINRDDLASLRPDIQKQWIKENYIMFNALYFNNELPDIDEIKFTAIKRSNVSFLGKAYNSYPFEIKLNFRYHLVELEWQNVLLHEMVHIWQYIKSNLVSTINSLIVTFINSWNKFIISTISFNFLSV